MTQQQTPNYNAALENAIGEDLYGPGGEPVDIAAQGQDTNMRTVLAALELIERHLVPPTTRQLAGLALLKLRGGRYADLADWWMDHYPRMGPADGLTRALESLSLARQFRGVSGRLVGGRGMFGAGGQGGGR